MKNSLPPVEAFVWAGGLLYLYFFGGTGAQHFTICPLANMGFSFCPGCGLGRSVHALLHGEWQASMQLHPLGFFAVLILSWRIFKLLKTKYLPHG